MGRYVTSSQIAAVLGLDSSVNLDALDVFVNAAESMIDRETGRRFDSVTATRRFDISDPGRYLSVGDVQAVTAVGVADATGGSPATLTASDYYLGPSVRASGEPYHWISLSNLGSYTYHRGFRTVEITGTWGWATVPPEIITTLMSIVTRSYQQGRAGGVQRITDIPGLGTVEFASATAVSGAIGGLTADESRAVRLYQRHVIA